MNYDKPNTFIELPPAIIEPETMVTSSSSGHKIDNGCHITPILDLSCLDIGGYPSRSANTTQSNPVLSGTSQMVSPSSEAPEDDDWYIIPANDSIPGDDMLKITEAENKYNQQEIRENPNKLK